MRNYERNALILPDVFEESIFAGEAGLELFSSQDCVAYFATELALESVNRLGEWLCRGIPNKEDVDVAGCVLLVVRERPVKPRFFNSRDFPERFGDQDRSTYRFRNDAADLAVERIGPIEVEVFLPAAPFGLEEAFAFEAR